MEEQSKQNGEVAIRLAQEEDASSILRIYSPFIEASHTSFELVPPSVEEMKERIRNNYKDGKPWLVCTSSPAAPESTVLGYAYASTHRARLAYQWGVEV
jgi:phosphinothricin acetyltransferase